MRYVRMILPNIDEIWLHLIRIDPDDDLFICKWLSPSSARVAEMERTIFPDKNNCAQPQPDSQKIIFGDREKPWTRWIEHVSDEWFSAAAENDGRSEDWHPWNHHQKPYILWCENDKKNLWPSQNDSSEKDHSFPSHANNARSFPINRALERIKLII